MRVISKQLSGLGNQLFQYAAGLYFSHRYQGQLLVLQEPTEGVLSHGQFHRPFLLSHFQITSLVRIKNRFDHLLLSQSPRSLRLGAPVKAMAAIAVRHETKEQRYRFFEDLQLPSGVRTLYIAGYWQAW